MPPPKKNTAKKLIVDLRCNHILPINCIEKEIRGAKKKADNKIVNLNSTIEIIPFNINWLTTTIKRQRLSNWIKTVLLDYIQSIRNVLS